jgi:chlorite dismutase
LSSKEAAWLIQSPVQHLTEASAPFKVCAMDFLGLYPLSRSHNWYLIYFIDQFTKYAEFIPVMDQMVAMWAKVFVTI